MKRLLLPKGRELTQFRHIYTDGSCLGNPGRGGWAFVDSSNYRVVSGGESRTTNNRMELTACIEALEWFNTTPIHIHTDSQYVYNGITKWVWGWIKRDWADVKNRDLWVRLHELNVKYRAEWTWVKAHAGREFNEIADMYARMEAESR